MYTKKQLLEFKDKPVMLSYFWNSAKNSITGIIKEVDYVITFKKLDSNDRIKIRYSQIDNIQLLENVNKKGELPIITNL